MIDNQERCEHQSKEVYDETNLAVRNRHEKHVWGLGWNRNLIAKDRTILILSGGSIEILSLIYERVRVQYRGSCCAIWRRVPEYSSTSTVCHLTTVIHVYYGLSCTFGNGSCLVCRLTRRTASAALQARLMNLIWILNSTMMLRTRNITDCGKIAVAASVPSTRFGVACFLHFIVPIPVCYDLPVFVLSDPFQLVSVVSALAAKLNSFCRRTMLSSHWQKT